ncbi:MAG: hypothetical protein R3F49_24690 [Planctomycetota bacterium]
MSRITDLCLIALVAGLAWWLFWRPASVAAAPPAPPHVRLANAADRPLDPASVGEQRPSGPQVAPSDGLRPLALTADDPAILRHPSLRLVTVSGGSGRLTSLPWRALPEGGAEVTFQADQRALGLAIGLSNGDLELVAWVPVEAGAPKLSESPLQLTGRFERIALDVRDAAGARVPRDAFEVRWPLSRGNNALSEDSLVMPIDSDGCVLVPRRSGLKLLVRWRGVEALVSDPQHGQRVTLAAQ